MLHVRVVSGAGGGPEKTILNSPRFFAARGYTGACAYLHAPSDPGMAVLAGKAEALAAQFIPIEDRGTLDTRVVARLVDVCRRENVAIWHAHDYKTNLLGLIVRRFHPMRLVTTVHGWVEHTWKTPLYYWIDRRCLPRYERVICVSPDLYEACLACGVDRGRAVLIENAIDLDQFTRRHTPREAKELLSLAPDRPLVGAVGRLSAEKGFDRLIEAADRLMSEGLDFSLVIIGDGNERAALEAQIARLGRTDRIRLAGYAADVSRWFEAMDVFVLSSLREGLPNVVLEAMALETPLVATRIAGVPRLVSDGENGLLVEPDDVPALAAAMRRMLVDLTLASTLAAAARRTIERSYSFSVRMDKVCRVYDEMLGSNK